MKANTIKIISILMLVFCAFSLCSCGNSEPDVEELAEKNAKEIVGTWIVESVENIGEVKELADMTTRVTTHTFFVEGKEVQFLSNGSFTSSSYNLKYEMVDNQFIYTYKDQTYAYDCEITDGKLVFSTPDVVTVTLKKQ